MIKYIFFFFGILWLQACQEAEIVDPNIYDCELSFLDESETHPQKAQFEGFLKRIGEHSPGTQMAISTKDGKIWTGAAGYADLASRVPLQTCNKLMVGSVSKVFTGVLIMQLYDEGILSIDDKMGDWLDGELMDEIANADQVTIQNLLNHTSGIPDYLAVEQFIDAANTPNFKETQREKLEYIYGKKAEFAPNAQYSYSNSNYVLLGLIVEEARQMPLWDAVEKFIVDPLELKVAEMGTHNQPIPVGTARPYLATHSDKYFDIMQNAVSDGATGDGGVASNARDLITFMDGLFSGKLMSEDALKRMTETLVREDEDTEYGLGIEKYDTDHGTMFGHTGSTSSYTAYLFYFPDAQVTFSLTSSGQAFHGDFSSTIGEVFGELFDLVIE
ncbi:MAG: serine hydrolase domain-containing protein [Bacteroidota bacterium]